MGFQHGEGNEKLLTCGVCNSAFELDANFCTECRAPRNIALRAPAVTPSNSTISTPVPTELIAPEPPPPPKPPKPPRQPRIRPALYKFFGALSEGIRARRKLIYGISAFILVAGTYFLIQTLLFMSSNPNQLADRYIKAVAARDTSQLRKDSDLFPNPQNLPILPVEYQGWSKTDQASWQVAANWNGWFGTGEMEFTPRLGNEIYDDLTFSTKIKAVYTSKFLIFRDIRWVVADPIASADIRFGGDEGFGIVINNIPAGSVSNAKVKEGTYALFPGPLKIELQGVGFTKPRVSDLFIGSSGLSEVAFPGVEYEIDTVRRINAQRTLTDLLINCLRRECSQLPGLSEYSFDFSGAPDSYLYVDYLYTRWGTDPSCTFVSAEASSPNDGRIQLSCDVTVSANIRWIVYRILFTRYYQDGYDYKTFTFNVTADITRTSSPSEVRLTNFSIDS
ncbi:MAG: hypothetical protein RLZZ251_675 [Actinomycetota bacterium]|jgi:hypothetical protein